MGPKKTETTELTESQQAVLEGPSYGVTYSCLIFDV